MTTHSENLTRVQEELWYLINNEDTKVILEALIEKMNDAGDGSECLKQWRDEARAYMPADTEYDENYWVAAYVLHFNNSVFENLIEQLDSINSDINILNNDLNKLNKIRKEIIDEMEELYNKIELLEEQLESLREQLESTDEACYVISDDLYNLEHERNRVLENLRKVVKQIIT